MIIRDFFLGGSIYSPDPIASPRRRIGSLLGLSPGRGMLILGRGSFYYLFFLDLFPSLAGKCFSLSMSEFCRRQLRWVS